MSFEEVNYNGKLYTVIHKYDSGYWEIRSVKNPNLIELVKESEVSKGPLPKE
ncbi:hypothetical protein [Bacillus aerolatus]|uniref:hypothetical protein n=1 Tax=Bacillus aerolatus TaxID=2653354 RepID=UPI00177FF809|nr:hypothetical protein [Bacillus aerolatus]